MERLTGSLALCWLMFTASCSSITVAGSDDGGTGGTEHRGNGGGGGGGAGGATGTGGGAVGGSGGGSIDAGAVDAGDPCPGLEAAYSAALTNAKICDPNAASSCQDLVSQSLACPGCTTHVNDTSKLDAIQKQWQAANCKSQICPAIACRFPGTGQCVAGNTVAGGGTCIDALTPLPP